MEEQIRRELVEKLAAFQVAAQDLSAAWERAGVPDAIDDYPFDKSFDEVTHEILDMSVRSIRIPPAPRRGQVFLEKSKHAGISGVGIPTRSRHARAV